MDREGQNAQGTAMRYGNQKELELSWMLSLVGIIDEGFFPTDSDQDAEL
jgi:hypothetical protein